MLTRRTLFMGALLQVENLESCDAQARKLFTYTPDVGADHWDSYANDVLAGRPFKGDCDDLTSTVLDLLMRSGWPENRLLRGLVVAEGTKAAHYNHMVGLAIDRKNRTWVVGDTTRLPHSILEMKHRMFTALPFDAWSFGENFN